jgi:hypothetical protein
MLLDLHRHRKQYGARSKPEVLVSQVSSLSKQSVLAEYINRYQKARQTYTFFIAAGENLMQPLLAERASNMKICRRPSIARAMASIDMAHAYTVVASDSADHERGRCAHCPRSKENKVATKCINCCNFVCGQHATKTINYACSSCERNSDSE